jgi:hypothetical protein
MTKRALLLSLLVIGGISAYLFLIPKDQRQTILEQRPSAAAPPSPKQKVPPMVDGKKVLGVPPSFKQEDIVKIRPVNQVSADWIESTEKVLKAQGGSSLKDVQIQKVDSFIWMEDGQPLHVESVIVSLENDKLQKTKFRALVDAETGKILKTWDRPTVDSAIKDEDSSLKLDPRYHND